MAIKKNTNKYFVSFLGTGKYNEVFYNSLDSLKVQFVQTATSEKYCPDIPVKNHLIFCTTEAEAAHWKGLKKEFLKKRGIRLSSFIHVPGGETEAELWEIFKIIAEKIPENAEVVFDVTHGFRSLPILVVILLNYLKTTKNVSVKGCYYGMYDKGKYDKDPNTIFPIFDLTPFYVLNDMTNAISLFEKSGNASGLVELGKSNKKIKDLAGTLDRVSKDIETCRLPEIHKFNKNGEITQQILTASENVEKEIPPVKELLSLIEKKIEPFSGTPGENVKASVNWCIDYGWVQQAFTICTEELVFNTAKKNNISFTRARQILNGSEIDFRNLIACGDSYSVRRQAEENLKILKKIDPQYKRSAIIKMDLSSAGLMDTFRYSDQIEIALKEEKQHYKKDVKVDEDGFIDMKKLVRTSDSILKWFEEFRKNNN